MARFEDFTKDYLALIGAGVAATALVLVTALADLSPPWPPGIAQLTAIAQLVVLIVVFLHYRGAENAKITTVVKWGAASSSVFTLIYLMLFSLLIFEMPNGENSLRGLECKDIIYEIYGGSCPFLTREEISEGGYSAEKFWTTRGILVSRILMLVCWLGMFLSLVWTFASFAVRQKPDS